MTPAQRQRQRHREGDGKYAVVNPCYACGKSAGLDYYSHGDTDVTIDDALLVLCKRCADATASMDGPTAVRWADKTYWSRGIGDKATAILAKLDGLVLVHP